MARDGLRRRREAAGFSIEEIAESAGLAPSRIELGERGQLALASERRAHLQAIQLAEAWHREELTKAAEAEQLRLAAEQRREQQLQQAKAGTHRCEKHGTLYRKRCGGCAREARELEAQARLGKQRGGWRPDLRDNYRPKRTSVRVSWAPTSTPFDGPQEADEP